MEMADAIAITKADGDNIKRATQAQAEYQHALHLFPPAESGWVTNVLTCSALANTGIDTLWKLIEHYEQFTKPSGYFEKNREQQTISWFQEYVDLLLHRSFQRNEALYKEKVLLEAQVAQQQLTVHHAANKLIAAYHTYLKNH